MTQTSIFALAAMALAAASPAAAQSAGDWALGFGLAHVNPTSDNGTLAGAPADIGSDTQLSFTAEYYVTDNIGIELLVATPFEHDISLGGSEIGSTKHLPPTVSLNYHFNNLNGFRPFVGLGVNYTKFFEEESSLGTLELDESFGLAAIAGVEYDFTPRSAVRFDVRYIKIDSEARLNGASIGTADIDPWVFGVAYVARF